MSPEKSKELINIYPEFFNHPVDSCFGMFGFECGDGWFELLKEAIEKIRDHLATYKPSEDEYVCCPHYVEQIKEKYGTLRFYSSAVTDEMVGIIDEAERKSAITCEECGNPGEIRCKCHWYSTRCDECFNQDKE